MSLSDIIQEIIEKRNQFDYPKIESGKFMESAFVKSNRLVLVGSPQTLLCRTMFLLAEKNQGTTLLVNGKLSKKYIYGLDADLNALQEIRVKESLPVLKEGQKYFLTMDAASVEGNPLIKDIKMIVFGNQSLNLPNDENAMILIAENVWEEEQDKERLIMELEQLNCRMVLTVTLLEKLFGRPLTRAEYRELKKKWDVVEVL